MDNDHGGKHAVQHDNNRISPRISAIPCGTGTKFTAAALDKIKFLRVDAYLQVPLFSLLTHTPSSQAAAPSRFSEPPDPPPKLSLLT